MDRFFLSHTYLNFFFIGVSFGTHGSIFIRVIVLCQWQGAFPLLDYIILIFYLTDVSAHGPMFYRRKMIRRKVLICYRTKSQCTQTNFHSNFLSTIKNRHVCCTHPFSWAAEVLCDTRPTNPLGQRTCNVWLYLLVSRAEAAR